METFLFTFFWVVVALVNVLTVYCNLRSVSPFETSRSDGSIRPSSPTAFSAQEYSWKGDDFPLYYPVPSGSLPPAAMTLYDPSHYDLFSDSTPAEPTSTLYGNTDAFSLTMNESKSEWAQLGQTRACFERVRLGPEKRMFLPTTCHQTHCIEKLAMGLRDRSDIFATIHHTQHCLDYLRQWFLCAAHVALEEGDWLEGWGRQDWELLGGRPSEYDSHGSQSAFSPGKIRGELLCNDWTMAYDEFDQNYEEFIMWRDTWN